MSFGLKGIFRSWGPDMVLVSGDFIITASAIADVHPHNVAGFALTRKAAGVYVCKLDQAFRSVISSHAHIGPDTGIGTGSLPTSNPVAVMMSQGFLDASATNFVADTTGEKLIILMTASSALAELPANYRCSFNVVLAESALNS